MPPGLALWCPFISAILYTSAAVGRGGGQLSQSFSHFRGSMKVGFIGLGRMGREMAHRLLAAGYELGVYNRTRAKSEPLREAGARLAGSLGELARDTGLVLTMLADDQAVTAVATGADGLIAHLPLGGVHV